MKFYFMPTVLACALFCACSNNTSSRNDSETSQNDVTNGGGLTIHTDSIIVLDEEARALIFFSNKDFRILDAHAFCPDSRFKSIDSMNKRLVGCNRGLYIRNDTIGIQITPGDTGTITFDNVRILYENDRKQLMMRDTFFVWKVQKR